MDSCSVVPDTVLVRKSRPMGGYWVEADVDAGVGMQLGRMRRAQWILAPMYVDEAVFGCKRKYQKRHVIRRFVA